MAIVQTDLGWECEEDYLVYDAGTWLADDEGYEWRHYQKSLDGYAFGVTLKRLSPGQYYFGPCLVSTVPDFAKYYYGTSGDLPYNRTYKHFNRTWYFNTQHWETGRDTLIPGALPLLETYSGPGWEDGELFRAIFEVAGVRFYRTERVWSFLAGLSCGAAGQSLPKLEGT